MSKRAGSTFEREVTVLRSGPDVLFAVEDVVQAGDRLSASMAVAPWHVGPDGRPAVGALGVLVDNVLGYAVMATLPPGSWSISTEIWIDVLGPLPANGTHLMADAVPLQAGSFSAGQVVDESGRLVAVCRQRGRMVVDGPALDWTPEDVDLPGGVDDLCEWMGLRPGTESLVLDVSPALANPQGMLHGGVSLAASELAATLSRQQHGSSLATSSVHIAHTRAVPVGARIEFRATTQHAGRSLWLTDVVGTVDGKVYTTTRVTAQA